MAVSSWITPEAVHQAAQACLRGKGARPDAIAFRVRYGEEVLALVERLARGDYAPQPGIVFVTERPKHREVHAAAFRDRVVHHLLHALLEPRFERSFIPDSFACRVGKGTHAAARRLRCQMLDITRRGGRRAYALQMDIKSFFMSIHKPTLLRLLRRVEPDVLGLARTILLHDPAAVATRVGDPALFARVPPHKRLGAVGPDRGLPIGNLTSQFFANVYLNALDQFVKRTLGARCYVRYVDDFVLLHTDIGVLRAWEARIRVFLAERLRLEAHPVPEIRPVSEGVDFVGYVVRPGYVLPRRRVVRHLEQRLQEHERALAPRILAPGERSRVPGVGWISGPCRIQTIDHAAVEALRATWGSYEGHLLHADAHRLRGRLLERYPILTRLLRPRAGRLRRRFALPRPVKSLAAQLQRLRAGLDGAVLLVRIGAYAECARWQDARALGLRLRMRRGRMRTAGLPWRKVSGLVQRGLHRGLRVAVAFESPLPAGNVKARRLAYLFDDGAPGRLTAPSGPSPVEPPPRDAASGASFPPHTGKEDQDG